MVIRPRAPFFLALALLAPLVACLGRTHTPLAAASKPASSQTPQERAVLRSQQSGGELKLETTHGVLSVSALRADTLRLRWARSAGARVLPSFAVDAAESAPGVLEVEESDTLLMVRTPQALLRIDKRPLRLRLMDTRGGVVAGDLLHTELEQRAVRVEHALAPGERVFGLGDKVKGFDRRGQSFELWNTDAFGWKTDADPLYKSLPFFVLAKPGQSHGLFIDYPGRASVDVGQSRPDRLLFTAFGADVVDAYVLVGPEPKGVLEAYGALTGRTPLPPLWALGHHQSRYGYMSEEEVRGVVARMQKEQVPLDAIWLDIDFQAGNAPFTVDARAFPSFTKMVSDFRARGVRTVTITDLHIKSYQGQPSAGYAPYDSGAQGDHFIRDARGFFEGKVWPGQSVFPEFTLARSRAWWGGLYRDFLAQGVAGFWNDMNEPAVFVKDKTFPAQLRHRLDDGTTVAHEQLHNAYGSLNARATYEGVRALAPEVRPFILTRAAYAGVQRYAASWTGDNTADRSHLAVTIPQLLNLGVSGYPFNGADVGGFVGCPDAELFAEWYELGALQPFFRNHSQKGTCRREPWLFGAAVQARVRRAVEQRYRLLPYLYTVFEEAARTGLPVMRPLWLEYPNDASSYDTATVYLLGADLLVAPKLVAGAKSYSVVLPDDEWFDTATSRRLAKGQHEVTLPADESVRLFVRAGAILPEQPVVASTAAALSGPLELQVWPGARCAGSLYLDDGESFGYQKGEQRRVAYQCEKTASSFDVTARSEGQYPPWWRETRLVLHDVERAPRAVKDAAGTTLAHNFDRNAHTLTITLPGATADFRISATW